MKKERNFSPEEFVNFILSPDGVETRETLGKLVHGFKEGELTTEDVRREIKELSKDKPLVEAFFDAFFQAINDDDLKSEVNDFLGTEEAR